MLKPIGSSKFVSHKLRISRECDSRRGSQATKLEQRPWILVNLCYTEVCEEGLIQKQEVDIHEENDVQISIVVKNNVRQVWSQIMVMEYKQAIC